LPVFLFKHEGIVPEKDFGHNADYGKQVQVPNIRFHATVPDRNYERTHQGKRKENLAREVNGLILT